VPAAEPTEYDAMLLCFLNPVLDRYCLQHAEKLKRNNTDSGTMVKVNKITKSKAISVLLIKKSTVYKKSDKIWPVISTVTLFTQCLLQFDPKLPKIHQLNLRWESKFTAHRRNAII